MVFLVTKAALAATVIGLGVTFGALSYLARQGQQNPNGNKGFEVSFLPKEPPPLNNPQQLPDCNCKVVTECAQFSRASPSNSRRIFSFRLGRTCGFQGFQRKVCCDDVQFFSTPPPNFALDEIKSMHAQLTTPPTPSCIHKHVGDDISQCSCAHFGDDDVTYKYEGSSSSSQLQTTTLRSGDATSTSTSGGSSGGGVEQNDEIVIMDVGDVGDTTTPSSSVSSTSAKSRPKIVFPDLSEYFPNVETGTAYPFEAMFRGRTGGIESLFEEGEATTVDPVIGSSSESTRRKFPSLSEYFPEDDSFDGGDDEASSNRHLARASTTTTGATLDGSSSTTTEISRGEEAATLSPNSTDKDEFFMTTASSIQEASINVTESENSTESIFTTSSSPFQEDLDEMTIATSISNISSTVSPSLSTSTSSSASPDFPDVTEDIIHGSQRGTQSPQDLKLELRNGSNTTASTEEDSEKTEMRTMMSIVEMVMSEGHTSISIGPTTLSPLSAEMDSSRELDLTTAIPTLDDELPAKETTVPANETLYVNVTTTEASVSFLLSSSSGKDLMETTTASSSGEVSTDNYNDEVDIPALTTMKSLSGGDENEDVTSTIDSILSTTTSEAPSSSSSSSSPGDRRPHALTAEAIEEGTTSAPSTTAKSLPYEEVTTESELVRTTEKSESGQETTTPLPVPDFDEELIDRNNNEVTTTSDSASAIISTTTGQPEALQIEISSSTLKEIKIESTTIGSEDGSTTQSSSEEVPTTIGYEKTDDDADGGGSEAYTLQSIRSVTTTEASMTTTESVSDLAAEVNSTESATAPTTSSPQIDSEPDSTTIAATTKESVELFEEPDLRSSISTELPTVSTPAEETNTLTSSLKTINSEPTTLSPLEDGKETTTEKSGLEEEEDLTTPTATFDKTKTDDNDSVSEATTLQSTRSVTTTEASVTTESALGSPAEISSPESATVAATTTSSQADLEPDSTTIATTTKEPVELYEEPDLRSSISTELPIVSTPTAEATTSLSSVEDVQSEPTTLAPLENGKVTTTVKSESEETTSITSIEKTDDDVDKPEATTTSTSTNIPEHDSSVRIETGSVSTESQLASTQRTSKSELETTTVEESVEFFDKKEVVTTTSSESPASSTPAADDHAAGLENVASTLSPESGLEGVASTLSPTEDVATTEKSASEKSFTTKLPYKADDDNLEASMTTESASGLLAEVNSSEPAMVADTTTPSQAESDSDSTTTKESMELFEEPDVRSSISTELPLMSTPAGETSTLTSSLKEIESEPTTMAPLEDDKETTTKKSKEETTPNISSDKTDDDDVDKFEATTMSTSTDKPKIASSFTLETSSTEPQSRTTERGPQLELETTTVEESVEFFDRKEMITTTSSESPTSSTPGADEDASELENVSTTFAPVSDLEDVATTLSPIEDVKATEKSSSEKPLTTKLPDKADDYHFEASTTTQASSGSGTTEIDSISTESVTTSSSSPQTATEEFDDRSEMQTSTEGLLKSSQSKLDALPQTTSAGTVEPPTTSIPDGTSLDESEEDEIRYYEQAEKRTTPEPQAISTEVPEQKESVEPEDSTETPSTTPVQNATQNEDEASTQSIGILSTTQSFFDDIMSFFSSTLAPPTTTESESELEAVTTTKSVEFSEEPETQSTTPVETQKLSTDATEASPSTTSSSKLNDVESESTTLTPDEDITTVKPERGEVSPTTIISRNENDGNNLEATTIQIGDSSSSAATESASVSTESATLPTSSSTEINVSDREEFANKPDIQTTMSSAMEVPSTLPPSEPDDSFQTTTIREEVVTEKTKETATISTSDLKLEDENEIDGDQQFTSVKPPTSTEATTTLSEEDKATSIPNSVATSTIASAPTAVETTTASESLELDNGPVLNGEQETTTLASTTSSKLSEATTFATSSASTSSKGADDESVATSTGAAISTSEVLEMTTSSNNDNADEVEIKLVKMETTTMESVIEIRDDDIDDIENPERPTTTETSSSSSSVTDASEGQAQSTTSSEETASEKVNERSTFPPLGLTLEDENEIDGKQESIPASTSTSTERTTSRAFVQEDSTSRTEDISTSTSVPVVEEATTLSGIENEPISLEERIQTTTATSASTPTDAEELATTTTVASVSVTSKAEEEYSTKTATTATSTSEAGEEATTIMVDLGSDVEKKSDESEVTTTERPFGTGVSAGEEDDLTEKRTTTELPQRSSTEMPEPKTTTEFISLDNGDIETTPKSQKEVAEEMEDEGILNTTQSLLEDIMAFLSSTLAPPTTTESEPELEAATTTKSGESSDELEMKSTTPVETLKVSTTESSTQTSKSDDGESESKSSTLTPIEDITTVKSEGDEPSTTTTSPSSLPTKTITRASESENESSDDIITTFTSKIETTTKETDDIGTGAEASITTEADVDQTTTPPLSTTTKTGTESGASSLARETTTLKSQSDATTLYETKTEAEAATTEFSVASSEMTSASTSSSSEQIVTTESKLLEESTTMGSVPDNAIPYSAPVEGNEQTTQASMTTSTEVEDMTTLSQGPSSSKSESVSTTTTAEELGQDATTPESPSAAATSSEHSLSTTRTSEGENENIDDTTTFISKIETTTKETDTGTEFSTTTEEIPASNRMSKTAKIDEEGGSMSTTTISPKLAKTQASESDAEDVTTAQSNSEATGDEGILSTTQSFLEDIMSLLNSVVTTASPIDVNGDNTETESVSGSTEEGETVAKIGMVTTSATISEQEDETTTIASRFESSTLAAVSSRIETTTGTTVDFEQGQSEKSSSEGAATTTLATDELTTPVDTTTTVPEMSEQDDVSITVRSSGSTTPSSSVVEEIATATLSSGNAERISTSFSLDSDENTTPFSVTIMNDRMDEMSTVKSMITSSTAESTFQSQSSTLSDDASVTELTATSTEADLDIENRNKESTKGVMITTTANPKEENEAALLSNDDKLEASTIPTEMIISSTEESVTAGTLRIVEITATTKSTEASSLMSTTTMVNRDDETTTEKASSAATIEVTESSTERAPESGQSSTTEENDTQITTSSVLNMDDSIEPEATSIVNEVPSTTMGFSVDQDERETTTLQSKSSTTTSESSTVVSEDSFTTASSISEGEDNDVGETTLVPNAKEIGVDDATPVSLLETTTGEADVKTKKDAATTPTLSITTEGTVPEETTTLIEKKEEVQTESLSELTTTTLSPDSSRSFSTTSKMEVEMSTTEMTAGEEKQTESTDSRASFKLGQSETTTISGDLKAESDVTTMSGIPATESSTEKEGVTSTSAIDVPSTTLSSKEDDDDNLNLIQLDEQKPLTTTSERSVEGSSTLEPLGGTVLPSDMAEATTLSTDDNNILPQSEKTTASTTAEREITTENIIITSTASPSNFEGVTDQQEAEMMTSSMSAAEGEVGTTTESVAEIARGTTLASTESVVISEMTTQESNDNTHMDEQEIPSTTVMNAFADESSSTISTAESEKGISTTTDSSRVSSEMEATTVQTAMEETTSKVDDVSVTTMGSTVEKITVVNTVASEADQTTTAASAAESGTSSLDAEMTTSKSQSDITGTTLYETKKEAEAATTEFSVASEMTSASTSSSSEQIVTTESKLLEESTTMGSGTDNAVPYSAPVDKMEGNEQTTQSSMTTTTEVEDMTELSEGPSSKSESVSTTTTAEDLGQDATTPEAPAVTTSEHLLSTTKASEDENERNDDITTFTSKIETTARETEVSGTTEEIPASNRMSKTTKIDEDAGSMSTTTISPQLAQTQASKSDDDETTTQSDSEASGDEGILSTTQSFLEDIMSVLSSAITTVSPNDVNDSNSEDKTETEAPKELSTTTEQSLNVSTAEEVETVTKMISEKEDETTTTESQFESSTLSAISSRIESTTSGTIDSEQGHTENSSTEQAAATTLAEDETEAPATTSTAIPEMDKQEKIENDNGVTTESQFQSSTLETVSSRIESTTMESATSYSELEQTEKSSTEQAVTSVAEDETGAPTATSTAIPEMSAQDQDTSIIVNRAGSTTTIPSNSDADEIATTTLSSENSERISTTPSPDADENTTPSSTSTSTTENGVSETISEVEDSDASEKTTTVISQVTESTTGKETERIETTTLSASKEDTTIDSMMIKSTTSSESSVDFTTTQVPRGGDETREMDEPENNDSTTKIMMKSTTSSPLGTEATTSRFDEMEMTTTEIPIASDLMSDGDKTDATTTVAVAERSESEMTTTESSLPLESYDREDSTQKQSLATTTTQASEVTSSEGTTSEIPTTVLPETTSSSLEMGEETTQALDEEEQRERTTTEMISDILSEITSGNSSTVSSLVLDQSTALPPKDTTTLSGVMEETTTTLRSTTMLPKSVQEAGSTMLPLEEGMMSTMRTEAEAETTTASKDAEDATYLSDRIISTTNLPEINEITTMSSNVEADDLSNQGTTTTSSIEMDMITSTMNVGEISTLEPKIQTDSPTTLKTEGADEEESSTSSSIEKTTTEAEEKVFLDATDSPTTMKSPIENVNVNETDLRMEHEEIPTTTTESVDKMLEDENRIGLTTTESQGQDEITTVAATTPSLLSKADDDNMKDEPVQTSTIKSIGDEMEMTTVKALPSTSTEKGEEEEQQQTTTMLPGLPDMEEMLRENEATERTTEQLQTTTENVLVLNEGEAGEGKLDDFMMMMEMEEETTIAASNETHASYGSTTEYPDVSTSSSATENGDDLEMGLGLTSTQGSMDISTLSTSVGEDENSFPITEITKSVRREPDTDKTVVELISMLSQVRNKNTKSIRREPDTDKTVVELSGQSSKLVRNKVTKTVNAVRSGSERSISEYTTEGSFTSTLPSTMTTSGGIERNLEGLLTTTEIATDVDVDGSNVTEFGVDVARTTEINEAVVFMDEGNSVQEQGTTPENEVATEVANETVIFDATTVPSDYLRIGSVMNATELPEQDFNSTTVAETAETTVMSGFEVGTEKAEIETQTDVNARNLFEETTTSSPNSYQDDGDEKEMVTTESPELVFMDESLTNNNSTSSATSEPEVVTEGVNDTVIFETTTEYFRFLASINNAKDATTTFMYEPELTEVNTESSTSAIKELQREDRKFMADGVQDLLMESTTSNVNYQEITSLSDQMSENVTETDVEQTTVVSFERTSTSTTPRVIVSTPASTTTAPTMTTPKQIISTTASIPTTTSIAIEESAESTETEMGQTELDSQTTTSSPENQVIYDDEQTVTESSTMVDYVFNSSTTELPPTPSTEDPKTTVAFLQEIYDNFFGPGGRSASPRINNSGFVSPETGSTGTTSLPTTTAEPPFTVEVKIGPHDERSLFPSFSTDEEKRLEGTISNVVSQLLLTTHKNFHLLPSFVECAAARGGRGRRKTRVLHFDTENYPWMARVGFRERAGITFPCAGTIISRRYVLTSAHCATRRGMNNSDPYLMEVLLEGAKNAATGLPPLLRYKYKVEEVIPHPNYDVTTRENDLALIRLSAEIPFNASSEIKPICLPFEDGYGVWDALPKEGETAYLGGWGYGLKNMAAKIEEMEQAAVTIWPLTNCTHSYRGDKAKKITPNNICAYGKAEKDACRGDNGGPLMALMTRQKIFFQIGIVSYGPRCGYGVPGVYTRVSEYLSWILDTIGP